MMMTMMSMYFVMCCLALQLLPPSCFETLPTNPMADFSQTVNEIINILDEYNSLKYVQCLYSIFNMYSTLW